MFKRKSFFTVSLLASVSIILLLVYQNCGNLGANSGKNIFTQCNFEGCTGQDINALAITNTSADGGLLVPNFQGVPFDNINITGNCNTGGFSNSIVQATLTDGGTTSSIFSAPCNTVSGSTSGTFSILGHANLNLSSNHRYYLYLKITAYNQYLQEMTGANSFYQAKTLSVTTLPPLLSSLTSQNCSGSLSSCFASSNTNNIWKLSSQPSANNISATVLTSDDMNGLDTTIQGYCNTASGPVLVYIIPYGGNINNIQPCQTACSAIQNSYPVPKDNNQNDFDGYFTSSGTATIQNPIANVPSCSSATGFSSLSLLAPYWSNINSNFVSQSSARLAQIVVAQQQSTNSLITSTRNVIFHYTNPVYGNSWDTNLLIETVNRVFNSFYTKMGMPNGASAILSSSEFRSVSDRTLGASYTQVSCQNNSFYNVYAGELNGGGNICTNYDNTNGCQGPKATYYPGIRNLLLNTLGYNESPTVTTTTNGSQSSCGDGKTILTSPISVSLNGNTDTLHFSDIANPNAASLYTCNLVPSSTFSPMGSPSFDLEGQRIAACLTSIYLQGMWRQSYNYINKFVSKGVSNCTGSGNSVSCGNCKFQDQTTVQNTTGVAGASDCTILANFYNAVETIKSSYQISTPQFYLGMTQFYVNVIMKDLYNVAINKTSSALYNSIFNSVYPNISDTSVRDMLAPSEKNYCIAPNDNCGQATPFGFAYMNNFPNGSYPASLQSNPLVSGLPK